MNLQKLKGILLTVFYTFFMISCNQGIKKETEKEMEKIKPIDVSNIDENVKPGDNFYKYVNGHWIKEHPVPPEYSQYGAFTVLYEENQKKLIEVFN
jgi:predicted metalloendopeptidase